MGARRGWVPWALTSLLVGCDPLTPEKTSLEVSISARVDGLPAAITISKAFLSMARVEVISDVAVSGLRLPDTQIVQVVGEETLFSLEEAPPALYSRVNFDIAPFVPQEELPPEFEGRELSVLIEGQVEIGGGNVVQFRYLDSRPHNNIEIAADEGLDLRPGEEGRLVISQDMAQVFEKVNLLTVSAIDLTEGVLLIDTDDTSFLAQHPALREVAEEIEEGLKDSFSFVEVQAGTEIKE